MYLGNLLLGQTGLHLQGSQKRGHHIVRVQYIHPGDLHPIENAMKQDQDKYRHLQRQQGHFQGGIRWP